MKFWVWGTSNTTDSRNCNSGQIQSAFSWSPTTGEDLKLLNYTTSKRIVICIFNYKNAIFNFFKLVPNFWNSPTIWILNPLKQCNEVRGSNVVSCNYMCLSIPCCMWLWFLCDCYQELQWVHTLQQAIFTNMIIRVNHYYNHTLWLWFSISNVGE